MQEYYFANYRLLVDDAISEHESMQYLSAFRGEMPYTHTYTLRLGDVNELEEKRTWALRCPMVFETEFFTIHDTGDGWAIVNSPEDERKKGERVRKVVLCGQDYGELTVWIPNRFFDVEKKGRRLHIQPPIPLSTCIRAAYEAGMVMRDGLPLHASLVEKDGFGVVFLGPSGMGKSTQAKLWEKYLGADFLIGDRPGLRKIDGKWIGFGMPWDGKDKVFRQISVPVRALVWLEQAKENHIEPMNPVQAMTVMLKQAMMPVWDDIAMNGATVMMDALACEVPMYHLSCRPDEAAVRLTYDTICKGQTNE